MRDIQTSLHVIMAMLIQAERNLPGHRGLQQNIEAHLIDMMDIHAEAARQELFVKQALHRVYDVV